MCRTTPPVQTVFIQFMTYYISVQGIRENRKKIPCGVLLQRMFFLIWALVTKGKLVINALVTRVS